MEPQLSPLRQLRAVLRPEVTRDAVEDTAWTLDWNIESYENPDPTTVYELVWTDDTGRAEIHYLEDPISGASYLTVRGEEASARKVREDILRELPTVAPADARRMFHAAASRDDRLRSVYFTALSSDDTVDEKVVDLMRRAAEDLDSGVRTAVLVATGHLGWAPLRAIAEQLRDGDNDADVRRNAEVLLQGLQLYPPK
jgi:hypothetical protein